MTHVVPQFVCDDKLYFRVRKCTKQRIADDDAMGLEHSGYIRVCFFGLARGIHTKNIRISNTVASRKRAQAFFKCSVNRFEFVKERGDVNRND